MFNSQMKKELDQCKTMLKEYSSVVESIKKSVATIEFSPQGDIIGVNSLFLLISGYEKNEIVGAHHSAMCFPDYVASAEYKSFWENLRKGHTNKGTFLRKHKNGHKIWLEATYFPIIVDGCVTKIMKIASDVTEEKNLSQSQEAVFNALNKSQAIIEFNPQGDILTANDNFLSAVKYDLSRIKGKHHRIFCGDDFYKENPTFWEDLQKNIFKSGQFIRKDSHGNDIGLEATYNPIVDEQNNVIKVIKFATDITSNMEREALVIKVAKVASETSEKTVQMINKASNMLTSSVSTSEEISLRTKQTTDQIDILSEQAGNIQLIVSTIKSIADQTNLLALNAAIEAARAGDQGRGFAVVADEVRQLAFRTTESTKEISDVVANNQDVTKNVQDGINAVSEFSDKGREQIAEIEVVINEIQLGAKNVSEAVSSLRNV